MALPKIASRLEEIKYEKEVPTSNLRRSRRGNLDKDRNGMQDAMSRFFDKEGNAIYPNFAKHKFTVHDVMRSAIVKDVLLWSPIQNVHVLAQQPYP